MQALATAPTQAEALKQYERERMAHFEKVRELSKAVEFSRDAQEYALEYARFSHWMLKFTMNSPKETAEGKM
jgi:2-polyprenyl-6-methoxyphenol hydroxylase-like FAD-dependent oxidoreductase